MKRVSDERVRLFSVYERIFQRNPTVLPMNLSRVLRPCLSIAFACLAASCAVTPEKRIAKNPQLYAALPADERAKVVQGRIDKGMSREAVFLAWGNPDRVQVGEENGRSLERWGYLDRYPVTTQRLGMGWGWGGGWGRGGWCGPWDPFWMGGGPMVTYIPYEAGTVEFKSGRVASWKALR